MPEESHLDEMNAAIRAQRERQAAPRTMVAAEASEPAQQQPPEPEPQPRRGLLARLLRR